MSVIVAGWGLTAKDVPLIDLFKHAFRRARPGFGFEYSATFSMPSGCVRVLIPPLCWYSAAECRDDRCIAVRRNRVQPVR